MLLTGPRRLGGQTFVAEPVLVPEDEDDVLTIVKDGVEEPVTVNGEPIVVSRRPPPITGLRVEAVGSQEPASGRVRSRRVQAPAVVTARIRVKAIADIDRAMARFDDLVIDDATAWETFIIHRSVIPALEDAKRGLQLRPRGAPVESDVEEMRRIFKEAMGFLREAERVIRPETACQVAVKSVFAAAVTVFLEALMKLEVM